MNFVDENSVLSTEFSSSANIYDASAFGKTAEESLLCPRLCSTVEDMLADICNRSAVIIEPLSLHVSSLQEEFLSRLYENLAAENISIDKKVTIFLSNNSEIDVAGEGQREADLGKIKNIFQKSTFLSEAFLELAYSSEMARDIINLNEVFSHRQYNNTYLKGSLGYHLSLRGGMSHFYFS